MHLPLNVKISLFYFSLYTIATYNYWFTVSIIYSLPIRTFSFYSQKDLVSQKVFHKNNHLEKGGSYIFFRREYKLWVFTCRTTKNLAYNRVFLSSCKHNRLVIRLYASLLYPLRPPLLQLHANLPGSWRAERRQRKGIVPRHQGHRKILLAFIIVIAMSTSAVQYYHLHHRLWHCLRSRALRRTLPLPSATVLSLIFVCIVLTLDFSFV